MASYTPLNFVGPAALTTTAGTSQFTGSAITYIIRTWHFSSSAASKAVTASIKADAAGTRLFDAVVLTANVPFVTNGWWVFTGAGAHDIDANVSATTAQIQVSGYSFS